MAPLWRRLAAACILALGCSLAAAQEKADKTEKKYPSGEEVADLLKREPITVDTWQVWRGRLLDWINDRGQGTDPAFTAARKFVRKQANDKGELSEPLAKDHLAWYLLAGAYWFDEAQDKPTKEQLEAAKQAEKAVRRSIELDGKFAQAHRNLALFLLKEEDIEPGEEKDAAKLTPRLAEAVKELDEAARLNPKAPIGEVRRQVGVIAYRQGRYGPADDLLLQALKEEPELAGLILTDACLAILRNPKRDYTNTLGALQDLHKQYPKQPAVPFVLGLALVESQKWDAAIQAFDIGRELNADPAKVLPAKEVHLTATKMMTNDRVSWSAAANALTVLASQFPRDGVLACRHALARFAANDYSLAASEIARARTLETKPEQVFEDFSKGSSRLVPEIEFQAVRSRFQWGFLWIAGAIGALYGLGLMLMAAVAPRPGTLAKQEGVVLPKPGVWISPGMIVAALFLSVGLSYLLWQVFGISFYLALVPVVIAVGIGVTLYRKATEKSGEQLPWPAEPPALSGFYALTLLAGIGLFYAAVLFLAVGLVVLIGGLIFLLLSAPTMSLSLLLLLGVVGVLTWFFFAMILVTPPRTKLGIAVSGTDIARLRDAVNEVTRRLDVDPIDEIRLTTTPGVNVYHVGWGPLGVFGGRRRVLVVGYPALRLLTVPELQALIAQQLAPLSRRDDERGRMIYRSWLVMVDSLSDMREAGTFNPFYSLLASYFWVFNRLARPFIRGRIAQADQTVAKQFGADVLESAMLKLGADVPLFKARLDELVKDLLVEAPDLSNMYAAWDEVCAESLVGPQGETVLPAATIRELHYGLLAIGNRERNQARRGALAIQGPGPHGLPALAERIKALPARGKAKKDGSSDITSGETAATLRKGESSRSAVELLDHVEGIEEQLTEFSISPPPGSSEAEPAEASTEVK
jgi:tetratricopeptide (TPR) repeat protein